MNKHVSQIIYSFSGIILFVIIWDILVKLFAISPLILPSPLTVGITTVKLLKESSFWVDVLVSFIRIILGFIISLLFAIPLGILLSLYKRIEGTIEPIIAFIRYIPPSAFIPITILWYGIGEGSKLFIIFLGIAPYITLHITDSIAQLPQEIKIFAKIYHLSKIDYIRKILLPYTLPTMYDTSRIMIGAAWTFVIIAEIIGSNTGLGHLMIESQRFLRTDIIFACIITIGVIGIGTDYLMKQIKPFFPWQ